MNRFAYQFLSVGLLCVLLGTSSYAQKRKSSHCRVGLEYQIGENGNWGKKRPVILSVIPQSPAGIAGLKPGDILETIDGIETSGMSQDEISRRLRAPQGNSVVLGVSNFSYNGRSCVLQPECIASDELSERQVAAAFSLYSVEDESEQLITYPFDTGTDPTANFMGMIYYAFAPGFVASELDQEIAKTLSVALKTKGIEYNENDADILIDTYYSLQENPYYNPKEANDALLFSYRWNPQRNQVSPYPLLPVGVRREAAKYSLTFGVRIHDARRMGKLLWSCESTEYLSEQLSVAEYAAMAVPMILMQFPFVRYNQNAVFRIAQHRYNYTGVLYKVGDIGLVSNVVSGSPAQQAGIMPGDRIVAINGYPLADSRALSDRYIDFVKQSLKYRDANTAFTDRSGLKNSRYWNVEDYSSVAKMLSKERYQSPFSYLFSFRPWITKDQSEQDLVVFDIVRDNVMRRITVTPVLVDESYTTIE